jgi:hypothetical protein
MTRRRCSSAFDDCTYYNYKKTSGKISYYIKGCNTDNCNAANKTNLNLLSLIILPVLCLFF